MQYGVTILQKFNCPKTWTPFKCFYNMQILNFYSFFFSFHLDIEQKRAQKWKWKYPGDINLHEIPLSTWGVKISEIVKHFEEKVSIDIAKKRLTQQLYWFTTEEKSVKKDHKNWVKETKNKLGIKQPRL